MTQCARATYQFKDDRLDITFYIHHDGYPTGAARYFKKMRDYEDKMKTCNHGLAEVFFRANDNAEFTQSHEYHGDTDYQYTLTMPEDYRFGKREHILEVKFARGKIIFKGTVDDFIAKASQHYRQWCSYGWSSPYLFSPC